MPHSEVFYAERSDFIPNVYTMSLGTMTTCWPSLKFFASLLQVKVRMFLFLFSHIHAFYQASRFRLFADLPFYSFYPYYQRPAFFFFL